MSETPLGRWGWELRDETYGVWLPRRARFTDRKEVDRHIALADALGLTARVIDYNPPKVVVKMVGS